MEKVNYLCVISEFNIKYDTLIQNYNLYSVEDMQVITSIEKSYHFHHLGSNF